MTPRNIVREDLKNLVQCSDRQMEMLIDYIRKKEKEALILEKQIYMMLKTKYEI